MDNFTPRAKSVQPIRPASKLLIRFHKVMGERCATEALYRHAFEAVRVNLARVKLTEAGHSYEEGWIRARFSWLLIFRPSLRIAFYSAGISIVVDADERSQKGWFKWARFKKEKQLIQHLCNVVTDGDSLTEAAAHPEGVQPPAHAL